MGGWAGWSGFGMGFGSLFMIVFWALVIVAVVAVDLVGLLEEMGD
jgi:hypothetical protein